MEANIKVLRHERNIDHESGAWELCAVVSVGERESDEQILAALESNGIPIVGDGCEGEGGRFAHAPWITRSGNIAVVNQVGGINV